MFRKRVKKTFPPGTFIPTPARVVAILQLCLAFTALIWACGYPFMGDLFSTKSKMLLYQHVMGVVPVNQANVLGKGEFREILQRNHERFQNLPAAQKNVIEKQYEQLNEQLNLPFFSKLKRSIHILLIEVSPYEQAWIVFALLISLFVLLRIEGALQAAWLLPVIVLLYGISQMTTPANSRMSDEEKLFPSEALLIQKYLKQPLSADILLQQEELKQGWKLYLIDTWAHAIPAGDKDQFAKQVEDGDFNFNLARIAAIATDKTSNSYNQKLSFTLLLLYLIWNLFFAWCVNRYQPINLNYFITFKLS